jgi:hypothetical protein
LHSYSCRAPSIAAILVAVSGTCFFRPRDLLRARSLGLAPRIEIELARIAAPALLAAMLCIRLDSRQGIPYLVLLVAIFRGRSRGAYASHAR